MFPPLPVLSKGILRLNPPLSTTFITNSHRPSSHYHHVLFYHRYCHHYPQLSPLFLDTFQQQQLSLLRQTTPSSDATRILHALFITMGSNPSTFISNNLLAAYAACGNISSAWQVFDKMPERNVITYNSMISAYIKDGNVGEAWKLFAKMMSLGLRPTQFSFGGILSSSCCGCLIGIQLHPLIVKMGVLYADAFSGTALLGLFVRHGRLHCALNIFEEMPVRSVVTWNSIIGGFSQHGFVKDSMIFFRELLRKDLCPSEFSFVSIISAFRSSTDSKSGEQIHGLVIKGGMCGYAVVANALIDMHAECSGLGTAERMFNEMHIRDAVSWNTMIVAFTKNELPEKALELFLRMPLCGSSPTQATFTSVIGSCADAKLLDFGKFVHAKTKKIGLESDVFVGSTLVDLYAKCNHLEDAHQCFSEVSQRNIVSWNALISGYVMKGSHCSVHLLKEMLCSGFNPNEFSFSLVLKTCCLGELQQLHSLIIRMGYEHDEYVSSSVIASYASCGLTSDALASVTASAQPLSLVQSNILAGIYNKTGQFQRVKKLLGQLEEFDIVSWNTLIEACARNGDHREAFEVFKCMQSTRTLPDNCTFMSLLSVCTKLCNLALGSLIHGLIIKIGYGCCDVLICNVLADMYAKCGNLETSVDVFNETAEKNLFSWTVLISALGLHGHAHEALQNFREMEVEGFLPDRVALIAILSACRHGGLVEEGLRVFKEMKDAYGVEPEMDHYACIVDLLCRNGRVKEAEHIISNIPFQPNTFIWRAFLEGCRRHYDVTT